MSVCDLDADGLADVVLSETGNAIVFRGRSDGSLLEAGLMEFPEIGWQAFFVDFDQDGLPDVVSMTDEPSAAPALITWPNTSK